MKISQDLTEGSIIKSLIGLSIPIIVVSILQSTYQLIDTLWVGRLGDKAVASVSIGFPIIFFVTSLGGGLVVAGTILVSQYAGKKDKNMVDFVGTQTLVMMLFVSIVLSMFGYLISPFLIKMMGAEVDVFKDAVLYLQISFIGFIFMFIYFAFQSLMRGVGDVKTPMIIVFVTVLLNLIIDPLFIFGYGPIPAMGVSGAAIATVLTQAVSAIIGIIIFLKGNHGVHVKLTNMKPDMMIIRKMFRLGIPVSIEQSARALAMIVMTFLVAGFGTKVIASFGIGTRVLSFIIIPGLGMSMAVSTLVGQCIGANKVERAAKVVSLSALISFAIFTFLGIIMLAVANPLTIFFIPSDMATAGMSALFLKIMALSFGFVGVQMAINGAFRGSGNTYMSMVLSVFSLWILRFPMAYLLSNNTSLHEKGIWIAFPIANVVAALLAIVWFVNGRWKNKRITEDMITEDDITVETIIEEGIE